jgi:hypothetical protein
MCKLAVAILAVVSAAAGTSAAPPAPVQPGGIRFTRDPYLGVGLETRDASLGRIAAALSRLAGCRAEVAEELEGRRLTLSLPPRPPERLFAVLARRTGARMRVSYRLDPLAEGERARRGSRVFAGEPVDMEILRPTPLAEALPHFDVPIEAHPDVGGTVRVRAVRHPLGGVLDHVSRQVNARWSAVVRFEYHQPVDADAAEYERMQSHFVELARLPPHERREEIAADLSAVEGLPEERRAQELLRAATDVLSLSTYLQNTPGEHRGPVWEGVLGIARDYWDVLSRMPADRRQRLGPVAAALRELERRLAAVR